VGVGGLSALTGHERPVRLEDEGNRTDFVLADIAVEEHALRCLRDRSEQAPAFRERFALTLEPGMGAMLAPELPRIERVTLHSVGLCPAIEALARLPLAAS
jgi:hypothetical protein